MSKNVIVTGGTRGIGEAISRTLRDKGYNVLANYNGNDEAAKIFNNNTGIPTLKWNVGIYDECTQGIEKSQEILGGGIDILINNAGITRDSMFHKMSPKDWLDVINTNLNSMFFMCHSVISGMRERKFGRIINISSINGYKGQIGQTNYSAAKAGIIGFTKALSQESANKNITVNAIAPGYVATDMTSSVPADVLQKIVAQVPVGRMGKPDEIANAVAFLINDDASFITGATIHINGGQYLA